MMSVPTPAPTTLDQALQLLADRNPNAPAITDLSEVGGEQAVSYGELNVRAKRTAAFLQSLGVKRGDSVATLLPNCHQWVDLFFAAANIGALLVPLNTRYRAQEISHLLRLSQARVLVTAAEFEGVDFTARLTELADLTTTEPINLEHVVCVNGDPQLLPSKWTRHTGTQMLNTGTEPSEPAAQPDDPIIVFGTSGTTSAPKLAIHTHRTVLTQASAVARRMEFNEQSSQLTVLSLSGTFGFVPFISALLSGMRTAMLPICKRPRVIDALATHPSELIVAAEGSIRELLDGLTKDQAGALRIMVTAGLSIEDIVDDAADIGITAMNVYGSSEIFAFAGVSGPGRSREERCTAGGPVTADGTDVRVTDPDTGTVLPIGSVGELQFRGATVFPRYLRNEKATSASQTDDGWFRTGDGGRLIDSRTFSYLARANDTLRLGGYSVSPADVETTIETLAGVLRAQVVGVRDNRTGDDLGVAFVLTDPASPVTAGAILTHCKTNLASFKVPKKVVIVDAYPTTPSANGDKVRRDQLRIRATEILAAPSPEKVTV
jgi:fatty-acyl-CoA synthase